MIEENQHSSDRPAEQPSGGNDESVTARVAQALGARVPDEPNGVDESRADEPQPSEHVPAPVAEHVAEPAPEPEQAAVEPAPGQFDVSFEGAIRLLNERLAEVVRREAALGSKEQGVQQALAEADDRWAELEQRRADVEQREAALALYKQELREVSAHVEKQRSELEQSEAALEQSHSALAEHEQALAERERAIAERERAVAEREAEAERNPAPIPALSSSDYEAQALALTEAVKAVAKHEAETVLKAAHDQARLVLESAHAERETLTPSAPLGEHDD